MAFDVSAVDTIYVGYCRLFPYIYVCFLNLSVCAVSLIKKSVDQIRTVAIVKI